ncbi:hypothetical protein [Oceaniglobus roseus]|uniref:hypothetical protein n=1 Tax=Oceaniglobus roseus TaxID=1737570 RepID=UPI00156256E0|nr:hypothetical protein [Kandeliimicrobium roseum]
MANRMIWLLPLLLLACAPYRGFYREGVSVTRLNADLTDCEVSGVNRVPPNTQIRTTPIEVLPPRRVCSRDGLHCRLIGGDIVGGETYTYDANAGLRARVISQCMAARGYSPVEIPMCSPEAQRDSGGRVPATLPPLGPNVCAVRVQGGGVGFLTTG